MDLFEELEKMAFNTTDEHGNNSTPETSTAQISRWQRLFRCPYSDAAGRIKQLRSDLSRTRVSEEHWEMVRPEKEAEGYDREAYEYEIQIGGRMPLKPSCIHGQTLSNSAPHASAFLVIIEGPLETPEKVQEAAGMSTIPQFIKGTGDTGETTFCRVDSDAKEAIVGWLSKHASFRPTFIRLSKAKKDLSASSIYPTLGLDSTLPQHRPDHHNTRCSPAQDEYPVWYFFYGTLADPDVLSRILSLPDTETPALRPASIMKGVIRTWAGKYKALIDASDSGYTDGRAYKVTSQIEEDALLYYETEKYEVVRCEITMRDEKCSLKGCTFRFAGCHGDLS